MTNPLPSIDAIACTTPEFSTACELFEVSGLDSTLGGGGPFTIFLPDNDGFSNLGQDLVDFLTDRANRAVLEEVLLNHAADSETVILSKNLACGETVLMLSGETTSTVCVNSTGSIFQLGQGNLGLSQGADLLPKIGQADILACNGVVHQVSNVILSQSIADMVTDRDEDDTDGNGGGGPDQTEPDCSPNIGELTSEKLDRIVRLFLVNLTPMFGFFCRVVPKNLQRTSLARTTACPFSVLRCRQPISTPFSIKLVRSRCLLPLTMHS